MVALTSSIDLLPPMMVLCSITGCVTSTAGKGLSCVPWMDLSGDDSAMAALIAGTLKRGVADFRIQMLTLTLALALATA